MLYYGRMKRTYKIPMVLPEVGSTEYDDLFSTFKMYSKVFNETASWGFENKTRSKTRAHRELYDKQRKRFDLPAALLQAARDEALEALRGCKFQHQPKRRNKRKMTMRLDVRTFTLRGNLVTFSKHGKRFRQLVEFPNWCVDNIKRGSCKAAEVQYDLAR